MEYISLGSNCSVTYQLNKLGLRKHAYPFDWGKVSLSQLIDVLSSDFIDFAESIEFKKKSDLYPLINSICEDNYPNSKSNSVVVSNKYGIIFAHELASKYQIEDFKSKIQMRIDRFKNLTSNPDKIKFVRIELNPLKSSWISQINQLTSLLDKIVCSYELILIINSTIQHNFAPNVKIHRFDKFSPDWKMEELDWVNIFV